MSFISNKYGQFSYFASQIGATDWRDKAIFDFGGNSGNLLTDAGSAIDHARYWCLDVSRDAIALGQRRFSDAHWLFYDRYNFMFNPDGKVGLPIPETPVQFDIILAYSVFTHVTRTEMLEMTGDLRTRLAPAGVFAFTFIDQNYSDAPQTGGLTNLEWRARQLCREAGHAPDIGLITRAGHADWCIIANHDVIYVNQDGVPERSPDECKTYHTYYRPEYVAGLFPDAEIRSPVNGEMQHCCIIHAG